MHLVELDNFVLKERFNGLESVQNACQQGLALQNVDT